MRFVFLALFLLLSSCAATKGNFKGVTFGELHAKIKEKLGSEIKCGEFSEFKFVTKLDFVICVSKLAPKQRQSVRLSYTDLPNTGPIVDYVFYMISTGAMSPKNQFTFGSDDFITEAQINQALQALK